MKIIAAALLCVWTFATSHPAVSSLSCVWNQDRPLQLSGTQDGPPLAHGEDGVPALQRRFGEETCSRESRSFLRRLKRPFTPFESNLALARRSSWVINEQISNQYVRYVSLIHVCDTNTPDLDEQVTTASTCTCTGCPVGKVTWGVWAVLSHPNLKRTLILCQFCVSLLLGEEPEIFLSKLFGYFACSTPHPHF